MPVPAYVALAAHGAVKTAIRQGKLTRQPCRDCGTSERVQAHHEDYAKPLDVVWLCPKHHREAHRNIPKLVDWRDTIDHEQQKIDLAMERWTVIVTMHEPGTALDMQEVRGILETAFGLQEAAQMWDSWVSKSLLAIAENGGREWRRERFRKHQRWYEGCYYGA